MKGAETVIRAVDGARAFAEKVLEEANARVAAFEDKLGALSIEKDLMDQALALEKIGWANADFALVKEKEWREDELNRLVAIKAET